MSTHKLKDIAGVEEEEDQAPYQGQPWLWGPAQEDEFHNLWLWKAVGFNF